MKTICCPRLLAVISFSAALTGFVRADEGAGSPPVFVYPDERAVSEIPVGVPVVIHAKYRGLVEDELELFGVPLRFRLADADLGADLLGFRPNRDNIAVSGAVQTDDGGNTVFKVTSFERSPSDVQLFKKRMDRAFTSGSKPSIDDLLRLAKTIHGVHKLKPDSELVEMRNRAIFEAYRLSEADEKIVDAHGHLKLVIDIFEQIPDRAIHAALLVQVAKKFPRDAAVTARLKRLGYRFLKDRWVDYTTFKRALGFVKYRDSWVKKAEKEHYGVLRSAVRDGSPTLILRSKTDRSYNQLVPLGQIERGMNRREVAQALGFPDRVRGLDHRNVEVDQWDYGETRVYFLDQHLYTTIADGEEK